MQILNVYAGPGQVLTGSARLAQEAVVRDEKTGRQQVLESRRRELVLRESAIQQRIRALEKAIEADDEVPERSVSEEKSPPSKPRRRKKAPAKLRIAAAHVNGGTAPSTEEP